MKKIKVTKTYDITENYTGIAEYSWGTKEWYLNGNLHRRDGPAVEFPDGRKSYYLNGKLLDKDKIDQFINEFDYPVETAIKLTYWLEMNES